MKMSGKTLKGVVIGVVLGALIAGGTAGALVAGFVDVDETRFYADPVEWAKDNAITTGSPAGSDTFKPDDPVTRGENVTFAYRYDQNVVQPALADRPTTSEVDQAIADAIAASQVAPIYAHVDASGPTITRGSRAVGVSLEVAPGAFAVEFDRDVSQCAYAGLTGRESTGVPGNGTTVTATPFATNPNGVYVTVTDAGGTRVAEDFYLVVICS